MKNAIHKIAALFLALLVLGSTMSVSIDKHYCSDHLVDVAIFGKATPCAMELALTEKYGSEHNKTSDCCQDEHIVLEGQDELKINVENIDVDAIVFISIFKNSYTHLFEESEQHLVPFDGYPPPLIIQDFYTLYEHYLI